jgi:DHA2 family multidrug resistance protein-like MFS transporter
MASGTADLQRDFGGAIMQSIFGALLTAGYTSAVSAAIAAAPNQSEITDGVQSLLQKSFSSAAAVAEQNPQYADQIIAGARSSFLDGADEAYLAGVIAVLLGATLVFFLFPHKREEEELLARYHAEDSASGRPVAEETALAPGGMASGSSSTSTANRAVYDPPGGTSG